MIWIPTWSRLHFDGHERLYLRAFEGHIPDPSPQAWPVLCALYRAIGLLTSDPRILTLLSILAGTAAVVGASLWAHRNLGPKEGLWTAILVALLPEHAAWSTSPYHVILPHALMIWGFILPRWWAALCIGLACSMRPELCLLAPFARWPGVAGITGIVWWLMLGGQMPEGSPWVALRANIGLVGFIGPAILTVSLGAVKDRRCWWLFGLAIFVHLSGSFFTDYGSRHALMGGVALCIISATVIVRWTPVLGLIIAIAIGQGTHTLSQIWLTNPEVNGANLPLPNLETQVGENEIAQPILPDGCIEVTEEPPIDGQSLPSHFGILTGEITGECLLWGAEGVHQQWSNRGLRDRARRMAHLYQLEPLARWQVGERPTRIYYRVRR